jgi:uncharacterized protein (DUF2062 family)
MAELLQPIPLTVTAIVWIATFLPLNRITRELVEAPVQQALAVALSAMLATTALLSWGPDIWYRTAVLGVCAIFVALYVAVRAYELGTSAGA